MQKRKEKKKNAAKSNGGIRHGTQNESEIRYLTPPTVEVKKKKYCRFKKNKIKYVDYKDPEFLKKFLNEQGKILPRTGYRNIT